MTLVLRKVMSGLLTSEVQHQDTNSDINQEDVLQPKDFMHSSTGSFGSLNNLGDKAMGIAALLASRNRRF